MTVLTALIDVVWPLTVKFPVIVPPTKGKYNGAVDAVKAKTGGELKSGESFRRKIKDDTIKLKEVYGLNQKVGDYGTNNCQVILQGPIELKLEEFQKSTMKFQNTLN